MSIEFEKEHIDTGKLGSEMLLTILGVAAQEESMSISKNLKWSYQKRMRSGEFITCSAPLGYFLKDNTLVPNPEESPIVEYIFQNYLAGKSTKEIARDLNARSIPTIRQNSSQWHHTVIQKILSNEKYAGNSTMQKFFTTDTLPFQRVRNDGQVEKYYMEHSHPAIIPKEMFQKVQRLIKQRNAGDTPKKSIQKFPLSQSMKCGICDSIFHNHHKNEKHLWVCYRHQQGKDLCQMGTVSEQEVYGAFLTLYNKLLEHREEILSPMLSQLKELQDKILFAKPDVIRLNQEISEIMKQNHSLSRLQSKGCIDSAHFVERSNQNNQKLAQLYDQMRKFREPDMVSQRIEQTKLLLDLLDRESPMLEFEADVFKSMVKEILVKTETFCFQLVNGLKLTEGR